MDISKAKIKKILKILPIGYYIKRDIKVDLTDTNASYYDIMNDKIGISYSQLQKTFAHIDNCDNIEDYIRCMLYHETSHALLTPKSLRISQINNIFEDERIETILRHYYKNVNFREFVKKVNNFNYESAKSPMDLFYQIVRYRVGPKKFLDNVHDLIEKYKGLMPDSYTYTYTYDIQQLYNEIETYFNDNCTNQYNDDIYNIVDDSELEDNIIIDDSELNNKIQDIITRFDSAKAEQDIGQILSEYKSISKQNGSAINAYSGKFDPRSVIRNDYKFFVQQNRLGHVKAYSKMHLNLFIDCSGSFSHNDLVVNKLLKALIKFEKLNSNFEFDLISCGHGQRLRNKDDRLQNSDDYTCLTDDIKDLFKQQQYANYNNFNIVLYDGDMFLADYNTPKHTYNINVFDTTNTILILDAENAHYTRRLKSAKVIITTNYVNELYKNVLIALKQMTKI